MDRTIKIHGWYSVHSSNLPPGLAKKGQLPPGLEEQLVHRATLPPGLQQRVEPCPRDLEHYLQPPDCANVLIGGHNYIAELEDQRGGGFRACRVVLASISNNTRTTASTAYIIKESDLARNSESPLELISEETLADISAMVRCTGVIHPSFPLRGRR